MARNCYLCGRELSEDLNEFCLAISAEAMEAQGVMDLSELRDETRFIALLCLKCGFSEGCPTAAEFRAAGEELERKERKQ